MSIGIETPWADLPRLNAIAQAKREAPNSDPLTVHEIRYDLDPCYLGDLGTGLVDDINARAVEWARRGGIATSLHGVLVWTIDFARGYYRDPSVGGCRRPWPSRSSPVPCV